MAASYSDESSCSEYEPNSADLDSSFELDGNSNATVEVTESMHTAQVDESVSAADVDSFHELDDGSQKRARGRKRVRQEGNWVRNVRKTLRNTGKSYVGRTGKPIEAKIFKGVDCSCRKGCHNGVPVLIRKELFEAFWAMGNFSKQNIYLCGLVQRNEVARRRPRTKNSIPRQKQYSFQYCLATPSSVCVCKQFFLQTFSISDGRLSRALKTVKNISTPPGTDKRGQGTSSNKTDAGRIDRVKSHISSFPAYESHYSRHKNPNRMYLSPDLNIRKMYNLYKESCGLDNDVQPVSETIYRNVFNRNFNLHFHMPVKDSCKTCDTFKHQFQAEDDEGKKNNLNIQHELHLRKAESVRNALKQDKENAQDHTHVCTFDLQKALSFPRLSTSVAYYKRNMYVYNAGIHDVVSGQGFMYVWDETIASRGSQEIASTLIRHLKTHAATAERIVLYSDCCTGQNRNIKVALSLLKLVCSDDIRCNCIDHKFFIPGHSFMPSDSDFGTIELAARKCKELIIPGHWYDLIKTAKRSKPFNVNVMESKDFLSTKPLEEAITKRKVDSENNQVNWLKMQWIRVEHDKPQTISFKTSTINEDVSFFELKINKAGKGRPKSLCNVKQHRLYGGVRPVTDVKKKDMLDLLPFIPPIYHDFFVNLSTENDNHANDSSSSDE